MHKIFSKLYNSRPVPPDFSVALKTHENYTDAKTWEWRQNTMWSIQSDLGPTNTLHNIVVP